MPLYDVEHVTPLTDRVQEELAKSITRIHAERFKTPSYFVDVRYFDASSQNVISLESLRFISSKANRTLRYSVEVCSEDTIESS